MLLKESRIITMGEKNQYVCNFQRIEDLHKNKTLYGQIGNSHTKNLNEIILGLVTQLFLTNLFSKQMCTLQCGIRKPCKLEVRHY